MSNKKREKFLDTYNGAELLKKHDLTEYGLWEVKGEDPNCDFGGSHHEPFLGHYEGALADVIDIAVQLQGFWQWGAGGKINKVKSIKLSNNIQQDLLELKTLEFQQKELSEKIIELKKRLGLT